MSATPTRVSRRRRGLDSGVEWSKSMLADPVVTPSKMAGTAAEKPIASDLASNDKVSDSVPVCSSHRAVFYAVSMAFFTAGVINVSVEWSMAPLARSLAFDDAQLSIVAAGFALGRCSGPMLMLYLLDLCGRRSTVLLCVTAASVVQLAVFASVSFEWTSPYWLGLLRACLGLCTGGVTVTSKTYLTELVPSKAREEWVHFVHMALQLGSILFTVSFTFLGEPSWHLTALATALPSLVLACALASPAVFPESPEYLASVGEIQGAKLVLSRLAERGGVKFNRAQFESATRGGTALETSNCSLSALLRWPFLGLVLGMACNQFAYRFAQNGNDTWAMSFLDRSGRADERFGAASSKFSCKILGGFLAAAFSARLGMMRMLVGGYLLCACGTVVFALSSGAAGSVSGLGVAYLGEEIASVLGMSFMIQAFPTALRGRGSSLVSAPNGLAGWLAGMTGALRPLDERLPFALNAGAMLLSAVVLVLYQYEAKRYGTVQAKEA